MRTRGAAEDIGGVCDVCLGEGEVSLAGRQMKGLGEGCQVAIERFTVHTPRAVSETVSGVSNGNVRTTR